MLKLKKTSLILILIICLSVFLRFYKLNEIPTGFHHDEVSQAYNAFALGTTGHDRYSQSFPLLFRAFGSYQPPLYTYLSIIPIKIFGNTMFAARFVSAFFGVLIVIFTYLIIAELAKEKFKHSFALLAALMVGISPWAIHFSRRIAEANLGLALFAAAFYFFIRSLRSPRIFPLAMLLSGISTHAYYSERIIAIFFIPIYLFIFRQHYFKHIKSVIFGLVVFGLTQLPHLYLFANGAFSTRFNQVSYLGNIPEGFAGVIYIEQQFLRHILIYISPHHLFADTGSNLANAAPELGVFYGWFFIPFVIGIIAFIRRFHIPFFKLILLALPVFLISASLTGDEFYTLRILEYLWALTIIISFGAFLILEKINSKQVRLILPVMLTVFSLVLFYLSYGILYKYEAEGYAGKVYIELKDKLAPYSGKQIIVDSWRDIAIGLRIAYFEKYDANKLSAILGPQIFADYYKAEGDIQEVYKVNNMEFRPFVWKEDSGLKNTILVGDSLAISEDQVYSNKLTPLFEIKNLNGSTAIKAYTTE